MRRFALPLALYLASTTIAPALVAAPNTLSPAHERIYKQGVKQQNAGDAAAALATFESIPPAARHWDTRLHIAACKQRLGRYLDAARDLEDLIAEAQASKLPAGEKEALVDTAQSDLDLVHEQTPKITVRLSARTAGVVTTVDGSIVTPPATVSVDPGTHIVSATRAGAVVFRKDVDLAPAQSVQVEVDALSPAKGDTPAPAAEGPPPAATVATPQVEESPSRLPGWIALGAGAVFAGGAVVSILQRNSAANDLATSCGRDPRLAGAPPADPDRAAIWPCDADAQASADRWQTIGIVSGALAAVSIGVGVYFLVRPGPSSPRVTARAGATSSLTLTIPF
jgi:hypothetical protein